MKKKEMIKKLVNDSMTFFRDNFSSDDMDDWIIDVLRGGFKGYKNMTLKELKKELKRRSFFADEDWSEK